MTYPITAVLPLALAALACTQAQAQTQTVPSSTRGQLLYSTHCIACHDANMHWRDKRQATDWNSLETQVRRWQAAASLQWSEEDITEVARHLNDTIYRYPATAGRVSWPPSDLIPRKSALHADGYVAPMSSRSLR